MTTKATYRLKNWKQYNRSLINRGNITLWISEDIVSTWQTSEKNGKRGRDFTYSHSAIECGLTLRSLFRLPLRKTQGLLEGLASLLKLSIDVPNYTTLSRRAAKLNVKLGNIDWQRSLHIVIDASGLKVYGEGEWKMRVHGKAKRRTWRKLHIAIDRDTQEIVALSLTKSNVHDSMETENLLSQIPRIASVTGDKGYDNCHAYEPIARKGARAIVPPRSGAALKKKNLSWGDVERNRLVSENRFMGKKLWKTSSGYSRRSLVETAFHRLKKNLGQNLHSRKLENQQTEAKIAAAILNKMTHLGMPKSYKI